MLVGIGAVSEFTFFPNDDPEQYYNAVTVVRTYWQGTDGPNPHPNGEWAIRCMGRCLNRSGEWEWEPQPSSRDDAFFARCRFHCDEAIGLARAALDTRESADD